jgi:LacI family transcriptional regulator
MSDIVKTPTIVDVAKLAGVSRATASRALGGYGRINTETIDKVKDAATRLGYRPNQLARAMRAGKTKTVGLVIVADFTNAFFDRATKAIVDQARTQGLQILIANTDENLEVEDAAVKTLVEKQVDGLIVVPSSPTEFEHLTDRRLGNRPLVLIDRQISGFDVSSVTTDDYSGARAAVSHVVSKGHRNLGFLVATSDVDAVSATEPSTLISTVEQRTQGFRQGIEEEGIDSSDTIWRFVTNDSHHALQAVREMLDAPRPPTAILTSNNDMAIAVLQVAATRGLVIGKDISTVTFDDSAWAQVIPGGLTVISRPVEELATLALEILVNEISDSGTPHKQIVLPCSIEVRGSVSDLTSA